MEPLKRQIKAILSLGLVALCLTGRAQSTDQEAAPLIAGPSYEIGSYMGTNQTINLMIMVRQAKLVTLKIKNAKDEILHELSMKKSPEVYHYKLNFENSQAGQYKLEISDGLKTLIRWIDVVDVPATEAQRYITFRSPFNQ